MTMIVKALSFLLVVSAVSADYTDQPSNYRALRFGKTTQDYIQFAAPDMTPFITSLTVTAWLKRMHNADNPLFLDYYYPQTSYQLFAGDNGYYNWVVWNRLYLQNEFPSTGIWFHYAMSWTVSGMLRVYINGEEVGSKSTSSTRLQPGGNMALGNLGFRKESQYIFGGELSKLYIFERELTAGEIQALAQSGMCSTAEQELSENTEAINWSFFLSKERNGQVNEFIPSSCGELIPSGEELIPSGEELIPSGEDCADELRQKSEELLQIQTELAEEKGAHNKTTEELEEKIKQLLQIQTELAEEKDAHNKTAEQLEEKSENLVQTEEVLDQQSEQLVQIQTELAEETEELNETKEELENLKKKSKKKEKKCRKTSKKLKACEKRCESAPDSNN